MGDFAGWLAAAPDTPETAITAHRRLVEIDPFNDGNGRTARLLMNLVLIRGSYPPVAVRPADRPAYTSALQDAQAGRGAAAFERLLLSAWKRPEGVPCCRARGADHLRSAESGWSLGSALSKLGQAASNAQNATNRLGSLSPKLS